MLLRTRNSNNFDWHALFVIMCGAVFQFGIFTAISLSFKVARMADLNIGISQAIWAINPFLVSIVEKVIYGVPFDPKSLLGMSALILCAVCVSLSEVISPADAQTSSAIISGDSAEAGDKLPVWIAVLSSFAMPVICSMFIIVIKHANETLKLTARDFTIAYWAVMSLVFQIVGIVSFVQNEGSFKLYLFINGFLASFFNLVGCVFAISSFQTGAPIGPTSALISTQVIFVTVAVSLWKMEMPLPLQTVGLVIGMIGALMLTIPDILYSLLYRFVLCRNPPRPQSDANSKSKNVAEDSSL